MDSMKIKLPKQKIVDWLKLQLLKGWQKCLFQIYYLCSAVNSNEKIRCFWRKAAGEVLIYKWCQKCSHLCMKGYFKILNEKTMGSLGLVRTVWNYIYKFIKSKYTAPWTLGLRLRSCTFIKNKLKFTSSGSGFKFSVGVSEAWIIMVKSICGKHVLFIFFLWTDTLYSGKTGGFRQLLFYIMIERWEVLERLKWHLLLILCCYVRVRVESLTCRTLSFARGFNDFMDYLPVPVYFGVIMCVHVRYNYGGVFVWLLSAIIHYWVHSIF